MENSKQILKNVARELKDVERLDHPMMQMAMSLYKEVLKSHEFPEESILQVFKLLVGIFEDDEDLKELVEIDVTIDIGDRVKILVENDGGFYSVGDELIITDYSDFAAGRVYNCVDPLHDVRENFEAYQFEVI
jgi:hypothetical protein